MADDKYADEALSDDELDNVAGGSFEELKADAQALESVLPPAIRLSYPSGIGNIRIYDRDAIIGVFKRCGVDVNFDFNKPNEYFRGGLTKWFLLIKPSYRRVKTRRSQKPLRQASEGFFR